MKVFELAKELQSYDPKAVVLGWYSNEIFHAKDIDETINLEVVDVKQIGEEDGTNTVHIELKEY